MLMYACWFWILKTRDVTLSLVDESLTRRPPLLLHTLATTSSSKLTYARRRVLHEIPSRGLNQGKLPVFFSVCSVVTKSFHRCHSPNNLGGAVPLASKFRHLTIAYDKIFVDGRKWAQHPIYQNFICHPIVQVGKAPMNPMHGCQVTL
jgi:hypothetical protein